MIPWIFHRWALGLAFALSLVVATGQADEIANGRAKPVIQSITPSTGPVGAQVSLSGTHFGKPGKIRFGSKNAKIQRWSAEQIDAVVPKGKGTVKVKVLARGGRISKGINFTYGAVPPVNPPPGALIGAYKVFANNDLGMHCVDKDFSVFSILPPYNVVNAQVVGQDAQGKPYLMNAGSIELLYSPIADASGSINSTSKGKSNFWRFAAALYGANLKDGQGLKGLYLPNDAPTPGERQFGWNAKLGLFSAEGIPVLPIDDQGRVNRYPLMRIEAHDKQSGKLLGSVDTVLPVSEETTCQNCHQTGKSAAPTAATPHPYDPALVATPWSDAPDVEVQTRTNVLSLHDLRHGTRLRDSTPVLCAECHYSPALDLAGAGPSMEQQRHGTMSKVMHSFHADKMKDAAGNPLPDQPALGQTPVAATEQACYQCHPGASTKCLRGAMTATVECQNCHGDMRAVGGDAKLQAYGSLDGAYADQRRPWQDVPRCQSCHGGDALNHPTQAPAPFNTQLPLAKDGFRSLLAFAPGDPAASPLLASNPRFAENPGQLFRHSKGHGALACEACHGSTHAIWPTEDALNPNDNIAAKELQGHAGTIAECATCHKPGSLPLTLDGPHGMHNVGDNRWTQDHEDFYKRSPAACQACHGKDLRGSALSRVAADRAYSTEFGARSLKKGGPVGCYLCHNGPDGGHD